MVLETTGGISYHPIGGVSYVPLHKFVGGFTMIEYHSFNVKEAEKYGVNAALILHHLKFWIIKNEANKHNFHDGKYWTYNSREAFKKIFPYMGDKAVRLALDKLKNEGVIITGNYNSYKYDRTKWFAFADYYIEFVLKYNPEKPVDDDDTESKGPDALVERANEMCQKGQPIPDILPDQYNNSIDTPLKKKKPPKPKVIPKEESIHFKGDVLKITEKAHLKFSTTYQNMVLNQKYKEMDDWLYLKGIKKKNYDLFANNWLKRSKDQPVSVNSNDYENPERRINLIGIDN